MKSFEELTDALRPLCTKGAVLAFSGGADSSLLLCALCALREERPFPLLAATMHSVLHTQEELDRVRDMTREYGVELSLFTFDPLSDPALADNPPDRCYLCKKRVFGKSLELAAERHIPFVLEGTNASDLTVWRPGRKALAELGVRSPLAELGFTKQDVRRIAAERSIRTASLPSSPCLATRFEYGVRLTEEKLHAVSEGEALLKRLTGGKGNVRLRVHGKVARIETDPALFEALLSVRTEVTEALKARGFPYVTLDLEGFRSGSMDPPEMSSEK